MYICINLYECTSRHKISNLHISAHNWVLYVSWLPAPTASCHGTFWGTAWFERRIAKHHGDAGHRFKEAKVPTGSQNVTVITCPGAWPYLLVHPSGKTFQDVMKKPEFVGLECTIWFGKLISFSWIPFFSIQKTLHRRLLCECWKCRVWGLLYRPNSVLGWILLYLLKFPIFIFQHKMPTSSHKFDLSTRHRW